MATELAEWVQFPADAGGFLFVAADDKSAIADLMRAKPGSIIRMSRPGSFSYIPPQLTFEHYGFIAGMISDGD